MCIESLLTTFDNFSNHTTPGANVTSHLQICSFHERTVYTISFAIETNYNILLPTIWHCLKYT